MVYRDYFESPLVFLHFLKQRRQATQEAKLALNDELDHLGMYIKHNMYCLELKEYPDNTNVVFHGYREDLDKYFCAQYHPQLNPEKPSLRIPYLFVQILTYLEKNNVEDKVDIADYFLNFASDAKEQLCDQIQYALQRQRQTGHMLAFSAAGEDELSLRYTVFVFQPKVEGLSYEYIREYVLSTMLWNEDDNRTLLEFTFDKHNQLISLKHHLCTQAEINDTEYEKLWRQGRDRASMRVKNYLKDNAHIENSDLCPCGSGRTYEKCCRGRLNQMITHFE